MISTSISIFSILFICFSIIIPTMSIGSIGKIGDSESEKKYRVFARILLFIIVGYCFIPFSRSGSPMEALLMIMEWLAFASSLAVITSITAYSTYYSKKWVSVIIAFYCYLALIVLFLELIFNDYRIINNRTGYFFESGIGIFTILYYIEVIVFVISESIIIFIYHKNNKKKRDRYVLWLILIAVAPAITMLLAEVYLSAHEKIYYPLYRISIFITFIASYGILKSVRKQELHYEDYAEILSPADINPVMICDSSQTVLFINKAAHVYEQTTDEFLGRKLNDIFLISEEAQQQFFIDKCPSEFCLPAVHLLSNKQVVLNIVNNYDCVGEILSSIVTVTGFNDKLGTVVGSAVGKSTADDGGVYDIASLKIKNEVDMIRGSSILVVSESANELEIFEKILTPYSVQLTTVLGGNSAIEYISEPKYDLIIISYDMEIISGTDTAKRIRNMDGDYYSTVPIVFCIDENMDDIFRELLAAGLNDFITRPLSSRQLNLVLTRWLWRRYKVDAKEIK